MGSFSALAASPDAEGMSTAAIGQLIEQLQENGDLPDAKKAEDIELLRQAISQNATSTEAAELSSDYSAVLASPATYANSRRIPPLPLLDDATIEQATAEQLQAWIVEHDIRLAVLASRQKTVETENRAARTADDQVELAKLRAESVTPPLVLSAPGATLSPQQILDLAKRNAQQARLNMFEQRELSRSIRLELWQQELDYLSAQIELGTSQLTQLQTRNTAVRLKQANTRESDIRGLIKTLPIEDELNRTYAAEVLARAEELRKLAADQNQLDREALVTQAERTRLQQRYASLTQQLELFEFGTTPEFGAALRVQRDQMASTSTVSRRIKQLETQITQGRLRQFRLDDLQQRLRMHSPDENAGSGATEIKRIDNTLVDELAIGYARYVQKLNSLAIDDREYVRDSRNYASLLDQNLLWMPSTSSVNGNHLLSLPDSIGWLLQPKPWLSIFAGATQQLRERPIPILIFTLITALLLHRRPRLKEALRAMTARVGKVNRDGHSLTATALLITVLLAAPGPVAMYTASLLVDTADAFDGALAQSLRFGALLYFILGLLRQSIRPNGLGELHFRWKDNTIDALRRNLPWFMALFVPALALNLFIDISGTALVRDGLGRIAFVFATLVLAVFAYRVMSPKHGIFRRLDSTSAGNPWHTRYVSFPVLVFLPIAVALLSVYGYHYTAVQIDAYLLNSLALVMIALLSFYIAERGIAINERRLALERIRAKRAAAQVKSEEGEIDSLGSQELTADIDVEQIDLQTISEQTRELLRVFIGIALGFALWNLWSDFLPAVKSLSNVHLWGGVAALDGETITGDVTLWAMLLAVATAALTFVAGRNIPSLLEVTLLSRLSLEPGTSYAVTTLARYIIVITGSVVTLQLLGAEWSKLQWLVAALSVGLGFGLQEIVANFVSGIVLLFERPIRIGDTVTVGDQFGTVSRIRIRATTMVDWDRREIVIPNKTFITERLVNWTLTDPITRTIIRVGVAYGTDVELTERLLLKLAADEPDVLADPRPVAVFMSFGESSLDFELRVFVRGVRELIPVKHALNIAIDKSFRENAIEIAFPQRDLHLDAKPIEVQIVQPHNPGQKDK